MSDATLKSIEYLKDYIRHSREVRSNESFKYVDFNEYCERECVAIETLISELEKGEKVDE